MAHFDSLEVVQHCEQSYHTHAPYQDISRHSARASLHGVDLHTPPAWVKGQGAKKGQIKWYVIRTVQCCITVKCLDQRLGQIYSTGFFSSVTMSLSYLLYISGWLSLGHRQIGKSCPFSVGHSHSKAKSCGLH